MKFTKGKEVVIAMALALLIDINLIGICAVLRRRCRRGSC